MYIYIYISILANTYKIYDYTLVVMCAYVCVYIYIFMCVCHHDDHPWGYAVDAPCCGMVISSIVLNH